MKKLIYLAALGLLLIQQAHASSLMDGFYGQIGVGFNNNGSEVTINDPVTPLNINGKISKNDFTGTLAVGYSYSYMNNFNLSANVFYNLSSKDAGTLTASTTSTVSLQPEVKNIWGISLEPGYHFTDQSIGYLKLGWAMASTNLVVSSTGSASIDTGNANGFLYGLGFKQFVNKNVYVGVDAYQIAFSSKSTNLSGTEFTSKPTFTYAGINVGYQF